MRHINKILILLMLYYQGCDLFVTREPEQPDGSRSNFETPGEARIVIQNLKNSFIDKNADNYKKNFALGLPLVNRNFFFLPTSQALSSEPNLWLSWNVESEFSYFQNLVTLVPADLPINITFISENYSPLGDSTIYTAEYSIAVPKLSGEPDIFEGSLKFYLITDNQEAWVIYYWEDIAKQGKTSWSDLKIATHP